MCWILLVFGFLMAGGGAFLIVRFFAGHGKDRPEVASTGRTESMIVGALLGSVGLLLLIFGITGVIWDGFAIC